MPCYNSFEVLSMKYVEYETKAGRRIELITRDELLKAMVEAKVYLNKNLKKFFPVGETIKELTIEKAKEEIEKISKEIPLVEESRPEDLDILLNDVINYVSVKKLEKRKRVLETAISVYEYIYNKELEYIQDFKGNIRPAFKDEETGRYIFASSYDDLSIIPNNWNMDNEFITKFATYLYNKANACDDFRDEEEYLNIEKEYYENRKKKRRKNKR